MNKIKRFKLTRGATKYLFWGVLKLVFVLSVMAGMFLAYFFSFIDVEVFEPDLTIEECKTMKLFNRLVDKADSIVPGGLA
jgi:hypothetical protein